MLIMSNQTTSPVGAFFSSPDGPYLVARIIAVSPQASSPHEISQIAWLNVRFDLAKTAKWSPIQTRRFGPPPPETDLPHRPPCEPADLLQVVTEGVTPDVLVAHDLAGVRVHFSAAVTGHLPWLGVLRISRSFWPELPSHDVRSILESRNLVPQYKKIPLWGDEPKCLREVVMMAVLLEDLLRHPHRIVENGAKAADDNLLGSVLGDLSAPVGLQGLLRTSAQRFHPQGHPPSPKHDQAKWAAMPLDDLLCYRDRPITESDRVNARAEIKRRVGDADFAEEPLSEAGFLIKRMP